MDKNYEYRSSLSALEGALAFLLMAAWSVTSVVVVGLQTGTVA